LTLPLDTNESSTNQPNCCFGCGAANAQGLRLEFDIHSGAEESSVTELRATSVVNLGRTFEGHPGYLHGGIIATLMDEAMSKLSYPLGVRAMTRHMEVDYLRPAPVDVPLQLMGRHIRREGRKLFNSAELRNAEGTLLAEAIGLFIVI